jgi:hypothetical protein
MHVSKTARSISLLPRLCSWKRDRSTATRDGIHRRRRYLFARHGGAIEWRPGWMVVVLLHSALTGRAEE